MKILPFICTVILFLSAGVSIGKYLNEQENLMCEFYHFDYETMLKKQEGCRLSGDYEFMTHHREFIKELIKKKRCDKTWEYQAKEFMTHKPYTIHYCEIEGFTFVDDGSLIGRVEKVVNTR